MRPLDKYSTQLLSQILPEPGSLLAIDTETRGLNAAAADFDVVGIGLAAKGWSVYIDVTGMDRDSDERDQLARLLSSYKLIAHNVLFDAAAMMRFAPVELDWTYCTYGLWRQIASEGYTGQRWGLKLAETLLLGWPERNDIRLNEWLVAQGYTSGAKKQADKNQLWRAPADILAEYCAADADACWQLYHLFDEQVLSVPEFRQLRPYHTKIFIPNVLLAAEQQLRGLRVDVEQLTTHKVGLESTLVVLEQQFLTCDEVAPHITKYNAMALVEVHNAEPAKLTKSGSIAAAWIRWRDRMLETAQKQHFNINSKQQLEWLFFSAMGYEPVKKTESGRGSVDKKSLPFLGTPGKILMEYNKVLKELGYVNACLDTVVDGVLHPRMRCPGTVTGRQSSGG